MSNSIDLYISKILNYEEMLRHMTFIYIGSHGCDMADETERVEEGNIITKDKFPVASIHFGDKHGKKNTEYVNMVL